MPCIPHRHLTPRHPPHAQPRGAEPAGGSCSNTPRARAACGNTPVCLCTVSHCRDFSTLGAEGRTTQNNYAFLCKGFLRRDEFPLQQWQRESYDPQQGNNWPVKAQHASHLPFPEVQITAPAPSRLSPRGSCGSAAAWRQPGPGRACSYHMTHSYWHRGCVWSLQESWISAVLASLLKSTMKEPVSNSACQNMPLMPIQRPVLFQWSPLSLRKHLKNKVQCWGQEPSSCCLIIFSASFSLCLSCRWYTLRGSDHDLVHWVPDNCWSSLNDETTPIDPLSKEGILAKWRLQGFTQ